MSNSKMYAGFRKKITYNGYSADIMKSAMQKYIRRGRTVEAIHAAIELDLFAYADNKHGEIIRTNFLHRLMIIYLEEVSLSNISVINEVNNMIISLFKLRNERKEKEKGSTIFKECRVEEEKLLVKLVHILSETGHSRILSHYNSFSESVSDEVRNLSDFKEKFSRINEVIENKFKIDLFGEDEELKKYVSNFIGGLENSDIRAVHWAKKIMSKKSTKNNYLGRRKKAEYLIFYILKMYLKNYKLDKLYKFLEIMIKWYNLPQIGLQNMKEGYLCWFSIIVSILNYEKICKENERNILNRPISDSKLYYSKNVSGYVNEMFDFKKDDFVLDMHTKVGKTKNRSFIHFAFVSSNQVKETNIVNEKMKKLYDLLKIEKENSDKLARYSYLMEVRNEDLKKINKNYFEASRFELIARAQLVTGNCKTDTYFAKDTLYNDIKFVKGPFQSEHVSKIMGIFKVKSLFMENNILRPNVVYLEPNMWEKTPLGLRNKLISNSGKYPFVVYNSLFNGENIPITTRKSKLWPETKIVNWNKVKSCKPADMENSDLLESYVLSIIFRYLWGIPDFAARNFIDVQCENGRKVISVDEETIYRPINLSKQMRGKRFKILKEELRKNSAKYRILWKKYYNIFKENYQDIKLLLGENDLDYAENKLKIDLIEGMLENNEDSLKNNKKIKN